MRANILTRNFGTQHGVSGKRVLDIANALSKRGMLVEIIAKTGCVSDIPSSAFSVEMYTEKVNHNNISKLMKKVRKLYHGEIGNSEFEKLDHISISRAIFKKVENEKFVLISSAPPFEVHKIASKIKNICGKRCNWVADFRDPPLYNLAKKYSSFSLIRSVINDADVVTCTTTILAHLLGFSEYVIVANGCTEAQNQDNSERSLRFIYGGSLKNRERRKQLGMIIRHINDTLPSAHIDIYCADLGPEFFEGYINTKLYSPLARSDYLNSLQMYSHGISLTRAKDYYAIPVKIYEYLNANLSVVAICPVKSAVTELSKDDPRVQVFPPDNMWCEINTIKRSCTRSYMFDIDKLIDRL